MDYIALRAEIRDGVAIAGAVIGAASAICALTKTPDPGTPLGKVYRLVEVLGVVVGHAKDAGVMPDNPAADKVGAEVVGAAKDLLGKA